MTSIESLSGRSHFRRVHTSGRRSTRDGVTVVACPREEGPVRLGLSVGRSAGKAVARNKIRRRLRHAVRAYGPGPADIVVVGRAPLRTLPFAQMEEYVSECLSRAGVVRA